MLAFVLAAIAGGYYASSHLGVTTDTDKLFSDKLAWKQREQAYQRLFPQFNDLVVVVIDAKIPEEADATAAALAARLGENHDLGPRPGASVRSTYWGNGGLA